MKRRWIGILWPGFLMAVPAAGLVFSLVDPHDVHLLQRLGPLGIYTAGFLFFWLVGAASSALTTILEERG
jgi:hypothetical protein